MISTKSSTILPLYCSMPAEVVFTIQHTNLSTAEAHNVSVAFYFTGFFNFSGLEYCNVSETLQVTPAVEIDNGPQRKVKFTVSQGFVCLSVDEINSG